LRVPYLNPHGENLMCRVCKSKQNPADILSFASMLYGLKSYDQLTLTGASLLLIFVALGQLDSSATCGKHQSA
jgi:hypothetical protein